MSNKGLLIIIVVILLGIFSVVLIDANHRSDDEQMENDIEAFSSQTENTVGKNT